MDAGSCHMVGIGGGGQRGVPREVVGEGRFLVGLGSTPSKEGTGGVELGSAFTSVVGAS